MQILTIFHAIKRFNLFIFFKALQKYKILMDLLNKSSTFVFKVQKTLIIYRYEIDRSFK